MVRHGSLRLVSKSDPAAARQAGRRRPLRLALLGICSGLGVAVGTLWAVTSARLPDEPERTERTHPPGGRVLPSQWRRDPNETSQLGGLTAEPSDTPDPAPGKFGAVVPHPIDEARQRLDAQRRLWSSVQEALERRDYPEVRGLLDRHDQEFSAEESWTDWREGYQLIADCRQHPGPETSARGRRFVDEQAGSRLRRSVRRACLAER